MRDPRDSPARRLSVLGGRPADAQPHRDAPGRDLSGSLASRDAFRPSGAGGARPLSTLADGGTAASAGGADGAVVSSPILATIGSTLKSTASLLTPAAGGSSGSLRVLVDGQRAGAAGDGNATPSSAALLGRIPTGLGVLSSQASGGSVGEGGDQPKRRRCAGRVLLAGKEKWRAF